MTQKFTINIDGRDQVIDADPHMPLLYALINDLGRKGPKFGCGLGQCGACTVIEDGVAIRSCITAVGAVRGRIRTLDGIGTHANPHPLQRAFIKEEAGQCEYCINGWLMTALAFLEENPRRTDSEIRDLLVGLQCRCGTHLAILRAVRRAADEMAAREA
jgi:aerobic-type carbon monoxide dehydrogenase small subunit (CoxS/CutS family)